MKKCKICQKEIEEDEEVCNSCIDFFKWKHKKDYPTRLKKFLKLLEKNSGLNSIKSNGRYKNE